ncbi:transposase [Streptomyces sp. M92]|uniref:transposase n=1 Tax=Streptomyces sp. M92 TaxID=2944250 RepID=UPI003FA6C4D7
MEAAELFWYGDQNTVIAHDLRVSARSVQRWRKAWSQGGQRVLASKGPTSLPPLSDDLFAVLEGELLKGPVAHGWPDQIWTLPRITLIGRRFHESHTVQGVAALLKRHGWSCQVPARRAIAVEEPAGLGTGGDRLLPRAGCPTGPKSGPSPVDRARPGSKHHLIVDGQGTPLAVSLTGGNRNDVTQLLSLLDKIPSIAGRVGGPSRRPDAPLADRGYDHDTYRRELRQRGIRPVIAKRGSPRHRPGAPSATSSSARSPRSTASAAYASAGNDTTTSTKHSSSWDAPSSTGGVPSHDSRRPLYRMDREL